MSKSAHILFRNVDKIEISHIEGLLEVNASQAGNRVSVSVSGDTRRLNIENKNGVLSVAQDKNCGGENFECYGGLVVSEKDDNRNKPLMISIYMPETVPLHIEDMSGKIYVDNIRNLKISATNMSVIRNVFRLDMEVPELGVAWVRSVKEELIVEADTGSVVTIENDKEDGSVTTAYITASGGSSVIFHGSAIDAVLGSGVDCEIIVDEVIGSLATSHNRDSKINVKNRKDIK